jgi:3-hydroxyisobutyrate dehydrogenase
MSNVTVLGMGAMGSRMAVNLIKAGHTVTVWNRTPAKTQPLTEAGAIAAQTPAEAVKQAEFVIAIVRDDEASHHVWLNDAAGALAAMPKGALAIESSTLTVEWARELAGTCRKQGVDFIDAPVSGSRPQAEAAQLVYLVGGEAQAVETARPLLMAMGSAVHHAGPAGSGAAIKLMVNGMLGVQVAALGELLGFIEKLGVEVGKAAEILAATPVCSPVAKMAASGMVAENFAPMFPVELIEKDFGYIADVAQSHGAQVPMAEAAHRIFTTAMEQGDADLNMTAIAKLYR